MTRRQRIRRYLVAYVRQGTDGLPEDCTGLVEARNLPEARTKARAAPGVLRVLDVRPAYNGEPGDPGSLLGPGGGMRAFRP